MSKVTMLLVMLPVTTCKSGDFSFSRLRSKVVGVSSKTRVGAIFCRLLPFVYVT